MREGRASTTASVVAAARGASGVDPVASRIVPFGLRRIARGGRHRLTQRLPLVEMMRARTLATDEAIEDAVSGGCRQLVVLGAGLCARAWRMPALAGSIVYEVDHPATQRYKRSRLLGLEPKALEVRFVSVDFEKDDLSRSLERAGHDASARTTWVWEGVTPYLTPPAIATTLAAIRARSAEGSTLLMTYVTPFFEGSADDDGGVLRRGRILERLMRGSMRVIGEPLKGLMSVDAARRSVEDNGFGVKSDAETLELGAGRRRSRRPILQERLIIATRPVDGSPSL